MTDTITLPREAVERALEALEMMGVPSPLVFMPDEIKAWQNAQKGIRAALELPQGEQEPVAVISDVWTLRWVGSDPIATIVKKHGLKIGDKLYTNPQNLSCKSNQARLATLWGYVKEQPKREPLTEDEIAELMMRVWGCASIAPRQAPSFARAIEAAHGIGGEI